MLIVDSFNIEFEHVENEVMHHNSLSHIYTRCDQLQIDLMLFK